MSDLRALSSNSRRLPVGTVEQRDGRTPHHVARTDHEHRWTWRP